MAASPYIAWNKTIFETILPEELSVQQTADGGFIAIGSEVPFCIGPSAPFLMKADKNGTLQWEKHGYSYGKAIKQTGDGAISSLAQPGTTTIKMGKYIT